MTSMDMSLFLTLSLLGAVSLSTPAALAAEYKVDPDHSKIGFSVRHLMISNVHGDFKEFEGSFNFDPDKGTLSNANFTAKAASVDTGNAKRDEHLRSPEFFDSAKFPNLTLINSKITKVSKDKYKWNATITIHGVAKPITLDLEHLGTSKDPWGNKRAGFTATGHLSRKEFGLVWNKPLETGGVVVGDNVDIQLDAEAIEQVAGAKPEAKDAKAGTNTDANAKSDAKDAKDAKDNKTKTETKSEKKTDTKK